MRVSERPSVSSMFTWGSGPRVAWSAVFAVLLLASTAFAQRVSLPTEGEYRPGEYIPLVIEADGPGVVSIRAPESLGIDWDAPGRTSVTVPWMTWHKASGELVIEINGRPQTIALKRLAEDEDYATQNPYVAPDNLAGPRVSTFGDAAYMPSYAWPGGTSARTRWLIVAAAGAVALALAAIKLALWRSRWTAWAMVVAGTGATIAIAFIPALNQPVARAAAIVEPMAPVVQSDRWIYLRSERPIRTSEPWSAYTYLFPRSPAHLESLAPVVRVRDDGLAGQIELSLTPGSTACLLQRVVSILPQRSGESLETSSLIARFYQ
jgi:hypothetical protein